jgi:enamine deaminase RidA (YjgF/YER057c/UK114 family)
MSSGLRIRAPQDPDYDPSGPYPDHVYLDTGGVEVVNGFSDLMVEVFGEQIGKHARSAVGMQALPSNSAVEVEMIVEVE